VSQPRMNPQFSEGASDLELPGLSLPG